MSLDEFVEAWKWLELKKDPKKLEHVFSTIDRKGQGYITEDEFLKSVMGNDGEHLNIQHQTRNTRITINKLLEALQETEDRNATIDKENKNLHEQILLLQEELGNLRGGNETKGGKISDLESEIEKLRNRIEDLEKN
eukprot:UN29790